MDPYASLDTWSRQALQKSLSPRTDQDYFARYGYYPEQKYGAQQAQQAGEQEWQQLVTELQARMSDLQNSAQAKQLSDFYSRQMAGENAPYDPRTVATLTSQATDPITAGARGNIERLREMFAARGLGRSGALGSLELSTLSDANRAAAAAGANVRAGAAMGNFDARTAGAAGAAGLYSSQQGMQNQLAQSLAQYRSQRSYDPTQFQARRPDMSPAGGYSNPSYSPPAPLSQRRTGTTVPTYSVGRGY